MNFEYIESIMNKMISEVVGIGQSIPLILADQTVLPSSCPYGTYKVIQLVQDPISNASRSIQKLDPTNFKEIIRINQSVLINITFLHDSSIAVCWELSEKSMDWFDSKEGTIECDKFGITPVLISPNIQDKTVLTESGIYIYKVSFDVLLKLRKYNEQPGESTASAPTVEYQEEA
ncbi:phage neck terminator protein [Leptospira interrogans]|uniref:phage neck terminator protein n=1 Tax=Leptospira interrogans TaxID=173 RepID=UPI00034874A0|nr:hypothetical protein [Leptospira interrogans]